MDRYFDRKNKRLVYTGTATDSEFWEKHWKKFSIEKIYPKYISGFDYVIQTTRKYLPAGSVILEGGCGIGQQVFKMKKSGYQAIGVDYAEETVKYVQENMPGLSVLLGDVRNLAFHENSFDGYWSFGVIEHFYNGYEQVALEMKRVIKNGGYLFLTFPYMNRLRKLKTRLNKYKEWNEKELKGFYQFALNPDSVIIYFKQLGFTLIEKKGLDGTKGLKDDVEFLKPVLQSIYDSNSIIARILNRLISIVVSCFASHSILLVFKNSK